MAGEKMSKKEEAGMCEGCCGGMCGVCGIFGALMALAAGAVFLLFGLGVAPFSDGMLAHEVAGAFLTLYGIGLLVHALKLCPMCK